MFGLKTKSKPVDEAPLVTEEKTNDEQQLIEEIEEQAEEMFVEEQPVQEIEEQDVIHQEVKEDKFSLAGLLGKTESGMKTEFYAYQIKEFMSSVGKSMLKKQVTVEEFDDAYTSLIKYGGNEILITPYFYNACKGLERKYGGDKVKFSTVIDYPCGESSFKARLADVKEGVKQGLDSITVVLSQSIFTMRTFNDEKLKLNKLCKGGKGKVGVAVNIDFETEDFRKIIKVVDGSKCNHIALLCEDSPIERIVDVVNLLAQRKFSKKILVYTSINKLNDLTKLVELKVDKVYTYHFEEIGKELERKFDVEL